MNMKFMGILLKEGRKEDLKKRYSSKFDDNTLDFILNISDLADFNHKYTDFVLKNVNPESRTFDDDVDYIVDLVKDFDKYRSQFPKKDINQYVSVNELDAVINHVRTKKKAQEQENKINKVFEDDKFVVVKPQTEEASCKYGSNTKWCVTSKGSGHFGRYTSGRQSLYFIINKTNSTNKNYSKVAIHFDEEGYPKYWDSQDSPMNQREIDVLNYAFPEMIESILDDYKKYAGSQVDKFLTQTFDTMGETTSYQRNYLNTDFTLISDVRGFSNIHDLGFGHSEGKVSISLSSENKSMWIDDYNVFITYKSKGDTQFTASIGFMGTDEVSGDDFEDLGLEGWGFDVTYNMGRNPVETAEGIRRHIAGRTLDHIKSNPKLTQKLIGTSSVWTSRVNYGYKFNSPDKGLVGKLVNYLDSGYDNGTKLDFLEYIGKIKSKVVDGKKQYAHASSNEFHPSKQWRGHFASFFAAAKQAGIIEYAKEGNKFILKPGPNFEAFKEGRLRAL